jgi:hypothetical protein
VTLEILRGSAPASAKASADRSGEPTLVRGYSSADPPEPYDEQSINVPMYWARPPRALPASKGMHRFVWDLRYPRPGAVQRDFPISAVAHDTPLEPLGVLAVPGAYTVKLTVDGQTFMQPITLKMDPRATITPLGLNQQFTLATKIVDLMNSTYAAVERSKSRTPAGSRQSSVEALESLNADLATAYDAVEGSDRAPTTQASRAVATLEQRARRLLSSSAK